MTLRRALTGALFGLLLAAAAPVAAANAAPGDYPPDDDASLSVSATAVGVGATITVTGSGFPPGPVTITSAVVAQGFAGTVPASEGLGSFGSSGAVQRLAAVTCSTGVTCATTANAAGVFTVQFTLTRAGTTVITASGGGVVLSQTIQVGSGGGVGGGGGSGGDAGGVGGLPDTGASLGLPITLGAILVLGGAGLIAVVRRRKGGDVTA